jgi:alkylmercury lyase
VAIGDLAAVTGRTVREVSAALAAVPDTEYDGDGRIIGQGLTLSPTPHRLELTGEQLYTWCALDGVACELVKYPTLAPCRTS